MVGLRGGFKDARMSRGEADQRERGTFLAPKRGVISSFYIASLSLRSSYFFPFQITLGELVVSMRNIRYQSFSLSLIQSTLFPWRMLRNQ